MSNLWKDAGVLDLRDVNGTQVIAVSFIFLAYFLHPVVESAYQRVRAYRAWRAIEKRKAVEVTHYPMIAELFGGRGRWDAARIITALLAIFSLASWGLELSMNLAQHKGLADLHNRPPPVEVENGNWKVKTRENLTYTGEWWKLAGMSEKRANSRYTLLEDGRHIDGNIVVASWDTDINNLLYYAQENVTTVEEVNCKEGGDAGDRRSVYLGEDPWGSVFTCDQGPKLTQNTSGETKSVTPPAIIMKRDKDGQEFLIVEESSSSPSFMYSVWNFSMGTDDSIEQHLMFHIAATMRLAEAVVTGIVHGETTGGGCFGLLRRYSEMFTSYEKGAVRAVPFGEFPDGDRKTLIEDNEAIDYGLQISANVLLCFVLVMLLTSIGVVWSVCLRSSIGMDVYDRDELIRAVSLHGVAPGGTPPSDIRIFVRREDAGNISVVISDTGTANNACARLLRRGGQVVEDVEPSPVAATVDQYNRGFGGPDVPVGPRTVWLEGVRTGMGRPLPGPNGNYHYPTTFALSASPVPSNAGSLVSTPIHTPSRRALAMRGGVGFALGRGPSVMFDSAYSSGDSPEETPRGMQTARHGGGMPSAGGSGPYPARVGGERPALAVSQATSASDIEMPPLSEHSFGNGEMILSPVVVYSTPPRKRGLTRSRGQLGHLGQESEDDTEESSPPPDNLHEETTECSPSSETRLQEMSSTGDFPNPV